MINQKSLLSGRTRREKIENSFILRCRCSRLWLVFLGLFFLCYFRLYLHDWSPLHANSIQRDSPVFNNSERDSSVFNNSERDSPVSNNSVLDPIKIERNETIHETRKEDDSIPTHERDTENLPETHESRKEDDSIQTHERDTETQPIGENMPEDNRETTGTSIPSTIDTRSESSSAKMPVLIKEVTEKQENADNSIPEVAEIIKESSETIMASSGNEGSDEKATTEETEQSPCSGRYIYIHNIPKRLNEELIEHCHSLSSWTDMCRYTANMGLGPKIPRDKGFPNTGWYETNQFSLEVIFHNRMKQYKCLTTDSSKASAIFVPYYAGLDVARYLWGSTFAERDAGALDLYKWLKEQPEWEAMSGRDHFLIAGRITWDFRRAIDDDNAWGNNLMLLPESQNVTMLTIESSPWTNNDFAIPYPTYFHPSTDAEVVQWQYKMRRIRRQYLYSYAGAPRPNIRGSIRGKIMEQCKASGDKCQLLECWDVRNRCMKPAYLMRMFQSSVFCLQPPGDSFTRRSTFDSIVGGCIPVFFHPGSAYVQYLWHLPKNYNKYSVMISEDEVKNNKLSIEMILESIPWDRIVRMREEVVKLIPKVTYADPRSRLETIEDAFDLTVKSVLQRVETLRKEMKEGTYRSFDEEFSWKYNFYGRFGNREWDFYFNRTHNPRYLE